MTPVLDVPGTSDLPHLARVLATWQRDDAPIPLHTGDLGWGAMRGHDRLAVHLRLWSRDGEPLAIEVLDGEDLLRLAVDPRARDDRDLAESMAADIAGSGILDAPRPVVEARGMTALRAALERRGWVEADPWTTLRRELAAPVDDAPLRRSGLRVTAAGPADAEAWMAAHRSAFTGTEPSPDDLARYASRWTAMTQGPLAREARLLLGRDARGTAVAIVAVWGAGGGRAGLLEPMGVHAEHRGHGYGAAITVAAALALRDLGASSAVVSAENANPGALATYRSAGFVSDAPICDLVPTR